jgi:hypothetical protein
MDLAEEETATPVLEADMVNAAPCSEDVEAWVSGLSSHTVALDARMLMDLAINFSCIYFT